MALNLTLKNYLFSAFRELFVYHHSSLEFRAKLFALVIAANADANDCEMAIVKEAGMKIYNDEDRANALVLTTKEFVIKVIEDNGLDMDSLVRDIMEDLKLVPRYTQKIDTSLLKPLIECSADEDVSTYQIHIIEFLERLKAEHLESKNE